MIKAKFYCTKKDKQDVLVFIAKHFKDTATNDTPYYIEEEKCYYVEIKNETT